MKTITLKAFNKKRKEIAKDLQRYSELDPTHIDYMSKEELIWEIGHDTIEFFLDEGYDGDGIDDLEVFDPANQIKIEQLDFTKPIQAWEPKCINPDKLTKGRVLEIRKQITTFVLNNNWILEFQQETSEKEYINQELHKFFFDEGYSFDEIDDCDDWEKHIYTLNN